MHDTLNYFQRDPIYRKHHQNDLTFAMLYHHNENFILPLSHDEVVHGKSSLLGRMPGDDWRRFANLRTLLGYQLRFPGKVLLFMGCEFGQSAEWNANAQLDWWLLQAGPYHEGTWKFVSDLNRVYQAHPALWQGDYDHTGFYWLDCADHESSVLSFVRQNTDRTNEVLVVLNRGIPVPRSGYRLGLPRAGKWREIVNSDAAAYGGSNTGNLGGVNSEPIPSHGHPQSVGLTLPPLGLIALSRQKRPPRPRRIKGWRPVARPARVKPNELKSGTRRPCLRDLR